MAGKLRIPHSYPPGDLQDAHQKSNEGERRVERDRGNLSDPNPKRLDQSHPAKLRAGRRASSSIYGCASIIRRMEPRWRHQASGGRHQTRANGAADPDSEAPHHHTTRAALARPGRAKIPVRLREGSCVRTPRALAQPFRLTMLQTTIFAGAIVAWVGWFQIGP